ncbi:hypothetical protein B0H11DRAFT_2106778 [Mycena galericulata]|nr:hypothetical protein B0H11DRAFT_2106778 [Mycena galericulata]
MTSITWSNASSDPVSTIELNHPSLNNAVAAANNGNPLNSVNPANDNITMTIPPVHAHSDVAIAAAPNFTSAFASALTTATWASGTGTSAGASATGTGVERGARTERRHLPRPPVLTLVLRCEPSTSRPRPAAGSSKSTSSWCGETLMHQPRSLYRRSITVDW